ncbi:MAG: metallophosphoesterase family protein, partial [Nitrososphaeraceae archaeon]
MKSSNYHLVHILIVPLLFSMILCNSNFSGGYKNDNEYDFIRINFLQNSYAVESDEKDEEDASENKNKGKSIFNIVAVGDWDCTSETEDTVDNIIKQDPEFVLALGDLSYNGKAKCWLELIEPIADKTKIVIGNHEVDSSKLRKDYMNYFGLENQYYSFNQKNVH